MMWEIGIYVGIFKMKYKKLKVIYGKYVFKIIFF